ncbi:sigma-70 family RNA polymerase sigma factor [Telmatocola sphagniphila]|uniref:Sigma-70 family RNA polymerase sigma factor n=1 Tax=Telmatocola sphagniphila TaxID=1123043 RepID=A0A8E6B1J4_9BACT|nr:sigma-70 family RNA polymerase sigma factor [Telmatocola sphagniphila]QVL29896.1 sigma-70 family RNA polymerase sigma factor [Telmatocola sphagniphila]
MKQTIATSRRSLMAAMVMGAALTGFAPGSTASAATSSDTIQNITKYCQTCWRNARLSPDSWTDCTQEVFVRLLERVDSEKWNSLLKNDESLERKEFLRAIDAVKKRTKRAKQYHELVNDPFDSRSNGDAHRNDLSQILSETGSQILSQRQQRILHCFRTGWSVDEIAKELNTTSARVSDEKYKAIRKLRQQLSV